MLPTAGAEVAVDFTVIDAARENLEWCADHGVHAVVGTSGFSADEVEKLAARFESSRRQRGDRPELRDQRGAR